MAAGDSGEVALSTNQAPKINKDPYFVMMVKAKVDGRLSIGVCVCVWCVHTADREGRTSEEGVSFDRWRKQTPANLI
jgi:hypothetical protein